MIAVKTGVAGYRRFPLDETHICGTFNTEGSFFICCGMEMGVPVVCGIPIVLCCARCCCMAAVWEGSEERDGKGQQ